MKAARLLQHFDTISEAPDAVARLRRLILDLAVRGKLVEQVAGDEPASKLLKRIAKEKAQLVKMGDLRKPRELCDGRAIEGPFAIPSTWRWVRLDAIGAIIGGGTPSATETTNFAEPGEGIAWLTPADLGGYSNLYISRGARDLSEKGSRSSSATVMPAGTVLFTSRAPIGYVAIAANPISTNQGFKSIVPYVGDCSRFIATAMKAFAPEIDAKAPGTTFKEVSGKIVAAIPVPLPPLTEQHCIVAKVDELMALCDQLQAARDARDQQRDRLVTASLHRLATSKVVDGVDAAADATRSASDTRFSLQHVSRLSFRSEHIQQLRQTILKLAFRGRLVLQDINDETASELIERIAHAKGDLVASKKLRKSKAPDAEIQSYISFEVPPRWAMTRLCNVFDVRDGTHDTPKYVDDGYPLVTSKNLSSGRLSFDDVKMIGEEDHRKISARSAVERFDVLLAMIGSIGNPTIVDTDRPFSIKNVALFKYYDRDLSCPMFLCLFLQHAAGEMRQLAAGGLQPFVSLGFLRAYPIALPPLAEQHRIVAKVDGLMALCDQLEASLASTQVDRTRLLDSLLHEALAPALHAAA